MIYGKIINNEMIEKVLNYSLTYTDMVFDPTIRGYIKILLVSKYSSLIEENAIRITSDIFDYEEEKYDISKSKEIFDYINANENNMDVKKEVALVKNYIKYFAKLNREANEKESYGLLRNRALYICSEETNQDLKTEASSDKMYNMYIGEKKEKYNNVSKLQKIC